MYNNIWIQHAQTWCELFLSRNGDKTLQVYTISVIHSTVHPDPWCIHTRSAMDLLQEI